VEHTAGHAGDIAIASSANREPRTPKPLELPTNELNDAPPLTPLSVPLKPVEMTSDWP